jgi:hypothetical protein
LLLNFERGLKAAYNDLQAQPALLSVNAAVLEVDSAANSLRIY